jgi:hypothetical protein
MRQIDDAEQIRTLICSSAKRDELHNVLTSYGTMESQSDRILWNEHAVEKIIALAEIIPSERESIFPGRAYCPLCGDGNLMTRYESGFSIPEGLRRHLLGWGRHAQQCRVMQAAAEIAERYWHNKFHPGEVKEEAQKRAISADRKKVETLYHIAPGSDPKLIDEGMFLDHTPRNGDELAWAEQRLKDLGLQIIYEGNIKSYTGEVGDFLVYADPREKGKITFRVYPKPPLGKNRTSRVAGSIPRVFHLMDRWKHEIQNKYESRLKEAIRR